MSALVGDGVTVSNVSCNAGTCFSPYHRNAFGTFVGGVNILGFDQGIILSSGSIDLVVGPNLCPNQSEGHFERVLGDPDLDALIPSFETRDAAVLEFDFECPGESSVSFEYVFASEEYHEYVGLEFNDVFGFFLNGVNIAIVPGTQDTPVSIHNVNCGELSPYDNKADTFRDCPPYGGPNCPLLRNNDFYPPPPDACSYAGPIDTEMDAFTVVLTATGPLLPGVNHIKLAIADAEDWSVDSNVFLKAASFSCVEPTGACCDRDTLTCVDDVLEADCTGDWVVGLSCDNINPPCKRPRMLVLLDRTGSMAEYVRAETGNTRCRDALQTAKDDVADFFINHPLGELAVWTFAGEQATDLTNGFVDQVTALAVLDQLDPEGCDGYTPLAEAMCAGVDALVAELPNPDPEQLILAVSSDGGENFSDGECVGIPSFQGSGCGEYDDPSWQKFVCDKTVGNAVVMVRHWDALAFARAGEQTDPETGYPLGVGIPDSVFFSNLAEVTGGDYLLIEDDAVVETGACCLAIGRCLDDFPADGCASLGGVYHESQACVVVGCAAAAAGIPALSEWSLLILALACLTVGSLLLRLEPTPAKVV